jgi:hypothetical protein
MLFVVLIYLFRGLSSSLVLSTLLVLWIVVWLWFGRFLWHRWQYQAARREILFIDKEQIIIRRPVSILGITHSYSMTDVSPFYFSEKHSCPAFDYAFQHVYFGSTLEQVTAQDLVDRLNRLCFPDEAGGNLEDNTG